MVISKYKFIDQQKEVITKVPIRMILSFEVSHSSESVLSFFNQRMSYVSELTTRPISLNR